MSTAGWLKGGKMLIYNSYVRTIPGAKKLIRGALACTVLAPLVVLAQSASGSAPGSVGETPASPQSSTLDEIVVTAEFRKQNLQEVPIAITSVNAAMIEARSLTTIADIGAEAPNVDIRPAGAVYGPASQITIRGIGQGDTSFALEPGVGTYIDDVYYSTVFGSTFELLDLDRVEILRGPQGTLEGQNSIGGAVKLFSKRPDGSNDAFMEGTVGSFNRKDLRGAVDFTVIPDELFVRATAISRERDGYVKDIDYGCEHPGSGVPSSASSTNCSLGTQGGEQVSAVRVGARYVPTDALEVNLVADDSNTRDEPTPEELTYVSSNGRYFLNGTPFGSQFIPTNRYTTYATFSDPGGIYSGQTIQPSGYSIPRVSRVDDWGVAGTVDYKFSDDVSLKSISAYRRYDGEYASDADASPFDFQNVLVIQDHVQASQELRLSGREFNDAVNYALGAFYFTAHDLQGGRVQYPGQFDFVQNDPVDSITKAGYAHLDWSPLQGFHVIGGVRFSRISKQYTFSRIDPSTGVPPPSLTAINGASSEFRGSHVDYNVNLQYQWSPDLMTYAQWSTGFRSGGVNERPFYANQVVPFRPETLDNYEVGLKSEFMDRRLRLNLAAFFDKYHDILLTVETPYFNTSEPVNSDPTSPAYNPSGGTYPAAVTQNAGDATIKGFELEANGNPTDALEIDLNASYIDFHYTSLTPEAIASGVSLTDRSPLTPRWKGSIAGQYEFSLSGGSTITPRFDYTYVTQVFAAASQSPYDSIQGYGLMNGRLMWKASDRKTGVDLFVTNLGDKFYWANKFDSVALAGVGLGTPGRPREWGLSVKRQF
jgi:iron complex outermembrane receptor protein